MEAGPQAHGWQPLQPSKPKCPSCRHRCGHSSAQPSRPGFLHSFNLKFLPWQPQNPFQSRGPSPLVPRPRPASPEVPPLYNKACPSHAALPDSGHSEVLSHLPCTGSTHCGGHRPLSHMGSSCTLQKMGCEVALPSPNFLLPPPGLVGSCCLHVSCPLGTRGRTLCRLLHLCSRPLQTASPSAPIVTQLPFTFHSALPAEPGLNQAWQEPPG